ncbi:MAG: S-layer homology domain-containing protein [Clostridiales bacterium]|nr:S-layer homology domain-containing protein [Clostridiales bacterium]
MKKRILAIALCLVLALSLLPATALADEGGSEKTYEAQITTGTGESAVTTKYETLDAAIEAAADGDTIELLADCAPAKTFYKSLTFTGGHTVTYDVYGWRYNGELVFDGANLMVKSDGDRKPADNGEAGGWFSMVLNGSLTAKNGARITFRFDSTYDHTEPVYDKEGKQTGTKYLDPNNVDVTACAIYMAEGGSCGIHVENGSAFEIYGENTQGVNGQGIQLGATANTGIWVSGGSTFLIDGTNRGYVNSPEIHVTNSRFTVQNCTSNASNGGDFTATNAEVYFTDNRGHGLSTNGLKIVKSTVNAINNDYNGIVGRDITIDKDSHVLVEGNAKQLVVGAFRVLGSTGRCTVDAGADVRIINNYKSGIQVESQTGFMEMNAGIVTGNGLSEDNEYGGGVRTKGTFTMSDEVLLYNNAAARAGDDIYVYDGGKVAFTDAQSDDGLTLTVRCAQKHTIDGWYQDGEDARWNADSKPVYAERYMPGESEAAGVLALKAAHGLVPVDPDNPAALSKSKEATNLNKSGSVYTSDVTLSLPSASYKPTIDVVFVLDDTSAGNQIFAEAATNLLNELRAKENLDVHLGIVNFDAVSRDWLSATSGGQYSGLVSIKDDDSFAAIRNAIGTELTYDNEGQTQKVGGTNIEWALDMASDLLESGSATEKHVVLFSDLYGYVYRGSLTVGDTTYENVPLSKRVGNDRQGYMYRPVKYSTFEDVLANRDEGDQTPDGFFRDSSWDSYWSLYSGVNEVPENTVADAYQDQAGNFHSFEKSTCLVYDRLLALSEFAHVTIVNNENLNDDTRDKAGIKDGMLEALKPAGITVIKTANRPTGEETAAVFTQLQNRLVQLVDAGSRVVDVIGHGTDNKGNAYNFDFASDADSLELTVGGTALDKTQLTDEAYAGCTAAYGFGKQETDHGTGYRFVLRYYQNGASAEELGCGRRVDRECFVLDINEAITVFAPVRLTYTVTLTDPQNASGSYGVYDRFGEKHADGLYTNERATIYPVDSNNESGVPEDFLKPTVSYRIGGGGGTGGGDDKKVTLHYVSNGGTAYPDERYDVGALVALDKVPLREDYTFTGWYADRELTERISEIRLPTDKTVYAGWEKTGVPSMLNGDDHIAYIVGYPQDYRTGAPTQDESLWPVQPQGSITRAEVATIFFRLLKDEVRDGNLTKRNVFTDVDDGMWFNQPVSTMAKLGIVKGRTADGFAPNASITRAEFAAICARFDTGENAGAGDFSDIRGHWAEQEIRRAASLGWILGYEDGTFRPNQAITRAEAMTMINRVLKRIPETEKDLLDGMVVWPDNQPGTWYYLAVQEATNSHEHADKGDIYEHWTKLVTVPDWIRYEK